MIIAVDGYSSCGKSTLSKSLAAKLGYIYIDTGAMYRAATLYILNHELDISSKEQISKALDKIHITFENIDGNNTCFLNGENVEQEIRDMRVSSFVSEVAAIPAVRDRSVELQRQMALGKDIVMDGRDIGTVVFPDADLKLFITADKTVRATRRYEELKSKGKKVTLQEIIDNLEHRDHIDTTREHSPLRQARDAIVIDNSFLSKEEQMLVALSHVYKIRN